MAESGKIKKKEVRIAEEEVDRTRFTKVKRETRRERVNRTEKEKYQKTGNKSSDIFAE